MINSFQCLPVYQSNYNQCSHYNKEIFDNKIKFYKVQIIINKLKIKNTRKGKHNDSEKSGKTAMNNWDEHMLLKSI
jgi:hypothetical protein